MSFVFNPLTGNLDAVISPTDENIAISNVTTNNVSTSKHGFFPKLPTATGKYLKDDLTWDTPAGGGGDFNVDGGLSNSTYDQVAAIDGGTS